MAMNTPERISYEDLPGLEGFYLEDSYVLAIEVSADAVTLLLEAVLTPRHLLYHDPLPGEQYCYVRARLTFPAARHVRWVQRNMHPISDPSGDVDYGNIDSFSAAGATYHLVGEWGELDIDSDAPVMEIVE